MVNHLKSKGHGRLRSQMPSARFAEQIKTIYEELREADLAHIALLVT